MRPRSFLLLVAAVLVAGSEDCCPRGLLLTRAGLCTRDPASGSGEDIQGELASSCTGSLQQVNSDFVSLTQFSGKQSLRISFLKT